MVNLKKHKINESYIYYDFPFDNIYETSRKEASRKKPIFFIHKYFARRTTCNFRLMLLSMLSDKNDDVWKSFYSQCKLPSSDNIKILDPFMGGGTTIYEALRLNANVIGNDLQPISKMVTLAEILPIDKKGLNNDLKILEEKVGNRIKNYYKTKCPHCHETADVMYNFHTKTLTTENEKIKLFSSHIIAVKNKNFIYVCPNCLEVVTSTKNNNDELICSKCQCVLNAENDSNVKSGKVLINGEQISLMSLKNKYGYPFDSDIVAIEYYCPHCKSHDYKTPTIDDINLFQKACDDFNTLHKKIPNIEIPTGYNTNQIINHGYKKFSDLYNKRQLLCLSILLDEINKIENENNKFWFNVAFSGILENNTMFCRYQSNATKISNIFFNHAYVPICMPTENCVWGTTLGTGTFIKTVNKIIKGKIFSENVYDICADSTKSNKIYSNDVVLFDNANTYEELSVDKPYINCSNSENLSFIKDKDIDIVLTDPPYSDNVMYSELLDFFHSWLYLSDYAKKNLGFDSPLTPKLDEIVVNKSKNKNHESYSNGLKAVYTECYRVLKDDGIMAFTYHDKNIDGWKSIYKSLADSGFQITTTYPIHSESRTGAHTSSKESIAFDMFLVCNKKISNLNLDDTEIINTVMKKLTSNIKRLNSINAELTKPDIINMYIALLMSVISTCENDSKKGCKRFEKLYENNKELLENLEVTNLVTKRTGWWASLHKI